MDGTDRGVFSSTLLAHRPPTPAAHGMLLWISQMQAVTQLSTNNASRGYNREGLGDDCRTVHNQNMVRSTECYGQYEVHM